MLDIAISGVALPTACTRRSFIGMGDMDSIILDRDGRASSNSSERPFVFATGITAFAAGIGFGANAAFAMPISSGPILEYKSLAPFTRVVNEKSEIEYALDTVIDVIRKRNESAGQAAAEILEVFLDGPDDDDFEPVSSSAVGRAIGFMLVYSDRELIFDAYEEEDGCVTVALKSDRGLIEVMFRSDARIAVYGKCSDAPPIKMIASIDGSPLPRDLIDAIDALSRTA